MSLFFVGPRGPNGEKGDKGVGEMGDVGPPGAPGNVAHWSMEVVQWQPYGLG